MKWLRRGFEVPKGTVEAGEAGHSYSVPVQRGAQLDAAVTETALSSLGRIEVRDSDEARRCIRRNDQLRYPVTHGDREGLVTMVDQEDHHLASESRVDEARGVEHRDSMGCRKAGTWKDEPAESLGKCKSQTSRHGDPSVGVDIHVRRRAQIDPRIPRSCWFRSQERLANDDRYLQWVHLRERSP